MRINKYLALNNIASRRKSEEYVKNGLVKVNRKVIYDLAFDIKANDLVEVDGKKLKNEQKFIYLAMHKPKGCICSASDELDRKTIFEYVPEEYKKYRLFSVGRLDFNTEGLIILTNDGELAQKLTKPSSEVEKNYIASIKGELSKEDIKKFEDGIVLDDGYKSLPAKVRVLEKTETHSRVSITITEGKNRQVRRMFEALSKDVDFLTRKSVGPVKLGGLGRGSVRELTEKELNFLKRI